MSLNHKQDHNKENKNNSATNISSFFGKNSCPTFFKSVMMRTSFNKDGLNFRILKGNPSCDITANTKKVGLKISYQF